MDGAIRLNAMIEFLIQSQLLGDDGSRQLFNYVTCRGQRGRVDGHQRGGNPPPVRGPIQVLRDLKCSTGPFFGQ